MKILILIACFMPGIFFNVAAQDEVAKAAQEACSCLKDLDPVKLSKRDLSLSLIGCISRPVDGIAEAMKQKNAWADSMALTYMNKVGKEAHALCPDAFERLKKKEVEVDPALLVIKPESELVAGYGQAVCNCLSVLNDVDECMKKVGNVNEAEITKRMPGKDPFTVMMGLGMDVMFELADHCELASSNETVAQLKKFPAIKDGCNAVVIGEYSTKTMLGESRSKFTANKLQEFSDGKLTAEYSLKWDGCNLKTKCTSSKTSEVKKGDESVLEIKRASADGFIAYVSFGKMKVPVFYTKVK